MIKKFFLATAVLGTLLISFPNAALADTCSDLRAQFAANGGGAVTQLPQYCTTGAVYAKVTNFLYVALGTVAVLALIYGGYLYMLSGANEANRKKGRQVIQYTIIGIIIVVLAVVIVSLVTHALVDNTIF